VAMTKMPMARRSDPNSTPIFKSPWETTNAVIYG
jgi:hypothetical protein